MKDVLRSRHRAGFVAAACLLIAISAPAAFGTSKAPAPYRFGVPAHLTGGFANVGTGLRDGITGYINYVNAHGGVNGRKIQIIAIDDQSNPANTPAAVKQLVEQYHVVAIGGEGLSASQAATIPLLEQYEVPMLTFLSPSADIFPKAGTKDWVYQTDVSATGSANVQVTAAGKMMGASKGTVVAVDASNTPSGAERRAAIALAAGRKGIDISYVGVLSTASDYSTAASQAIGKNPKVIITGLGDPQVTRFALAVRALGSKVPIINYAAGSAYTTLLTLRDPNFYVVRGIAYPTDKSPGVRQYVRALKAAKVNNAAGYVNDGYTQGMVLVAALKKCGGTCSGAKLRDTLDNKLIVRTDGLTAAPMRFSAQVHQGVTVGSVWHLVNNKLLKVYDKIYALPPR